MELLAIILLVVVLAAMGYIAFLLRRPKSDLSDPMIELTKQLYQQLEHTRQASERSTQSVLSQVQSFTRGMTELQEEVKRVQEQVQHVVSFQDIFRSPKLRGNWGEYSLESALSQYFPRGAWEVQHTFASGDIVDAILKLPNDLIVPIDSKFNWENFQKMAESDNDIARDGFRKQFLSDVKKKVDEIASKYILPGEGTTDFALMYVPAETVYYEIINHVREADVTDYARRKKVILCSPSTFYLTVTAVQHWFHDVEFSKQTRDIFKRLARIVQDAGKLADDFTMLGKHLTNATTAHEGAQKRLDLLVERTQRVIELGEEQKKLEH
ncbi:MAG TPA: DNA recombination protein RmuC [Candidatus Paceibacterota bacterium]|nr:DNA recombination protein RmuC [Candidatus Paceibacterota bacterium]